MVHRGAAWPFAKTKKLVDFWGQEAMWKEFSSFQRHIKIYRRV